jgi:hypothetical protein
MAGELAGIGFARTGFERDDGRMDLSKVTGGQGAVLQTKRQSLMDLAKLCGWIVEKHDDVSRIGERLRNMTDAERLEDAKQLAARIRETLDMDRRRTIEGQATGIKDNTDTTR